MQRRDFLKTGLAAGAVAKGQTRTGGRVSIVLPPSDALVGAAPVRWAAGELQSALEAASIRTARHDSVDQAASGDLCILAGGRRNGTAMPNSAEAVAIARGREGNRQVLFARGSDIRGLVYALLELA